MSEKQWFVLHTLTGQEAKVKESIERRLDKEELRDYLDQVLIPTEKVSEVKKGVKSTITRKFFPGYVLVHAGLYDGTRQLVEKVWYFIRETPGVIGFVGGERPAPLRAEEVDVLLFQMEEKKEKVKPKVIYEIGETLKITDGPFMNFTGVVEEMDADRGKLKVSVAIFGRTAPVELEYWQVERQ
ncbi:MAG: transcription termination/antitermination protein NusG [bacterium]|jgi:transcriptional antiterminator NusG